MDVLLNAASEETLEKAQEEEGRVGRLSFVAMCLWACTYWTQSAWRTSVFVGSHLAAFAGVHAIMEPRRDVPAYLAQKHHTSRLCERGTHASSSEGNAITKCKVKLNIEEEWGVVLTGERASETTRSFGHCGMVVGCGWHCCDLGNWSVVYFRKLKDHSRWRISSPLLPSLLQGPNFLKGDALWGWRLRVGGGRLGLVSTWGAARTWAGTAWWTSVQDNTTLRDRQGQRVSSLIFS